MTTNTKYISVKNWDRYQHYKDRCPPWIKLHRELITSHMWVGSDDASRVLAVAIMLLASDTDNKIPYDLAYIQRRAYINGDVNLEFLIEAQFIEIIDENGECYHDASVMQADASNVLDQRREEQRREENIYTPENKFDEFWEIFPRRVAKKAAQKKYDAAVKSGVSEEAIINGAKSYAKACKGKDMQYIAHPATWLNQGRWEDEVDDREFVTDDVYRKGVRYYSAHTGEEVGRPL